MRDHHWSVTVAPDYFETLGMSTGGRSREAAWDTKITCRGVPDHPSLPWLGTAMQGIGSVGDGSRARTRRGADIVPWSFAVWSQS